jgi:pimeloyl-ACP methyl ester carboxylesterase
MAKAKACPSCNKLLCSKCASKYALIVFDGTEESNNLETNNTLQTFCKECFQEKSVLDFSKTSQVIEPSPSNDNGITLVFGHGGGGSRAMLVPHAKILAESKGYRCVLFDFPGHGSRMEESLSVDKCVETTKQILEEYNLQAGNNTIYIGTSFGAYVGFKILKEYQEYFKAAVLLDCGQNVGPGASLKATCGLWLLKGITKAFSNASITNIMMTQTKKSPADWKTVECVFGAGFFFQQGPQQVECLKSVAPADIIPDLNIPILFFNGSEDYRDSEDHWLKLCKDSRSELKVFQGGDHFFLNDSRFVDELLDRIDAFGVAVTK